MRWLELLAIGVYVLEHTGSPSMVAFITALRLAPMFLCGSLIGAHRRPLRAQPRAADRPRDRERDLDRAGRLAFTGRITLWQIALGAVVSGAFVAGDMTLRRIMSAEIAGVDRLGQAMALESVNNNGTRMIGPALGGFLLETLGLYGVYLLGALLYLVGIVLILRTRHRSTRDRQREPRC